MAHNGSCPPSPISSLSISISSFLVLISLLLLPLLIHLEELSKHCLVTMQSDVKTGRQTDRQTEILYTHFIHTSSIFHRNSRRSTRYSSRSSCGFIMYLFSCIMMSWTRLLQLGQTVLPPLASPPLL